MNEKEKNTIEYLKTRLYGNEGCEYIDVAQKDLRIFINLIDKTEKNINSWKKYSDEQEENIIEKNNNICNLEFQIEKLQKENEELKNEVMEKDLEIIGKEEYTKASMGEIIEQYYTANEDCISIQKIKYKIEELDEELEIMKVDNMYGRYKEYGGKSKWEMLFATKYGMHDALQELLEGRK